VTARRGALNLKGEMVHVNLYMYNIIKVNKLSQILTKVKYALLDWSDLEH